MNSPDNHGPQSGGPVTPVRTVASIGFRGLGSGPPYGVCEARGCSELAELALRGIPLCGFHFHNAEYRWRVGHDRDLSLKRPTGRHLECATATELDRLADDGAWSIPATSWTAS